MRPILQHDMLALGHVAADGERCSDIAAELRFLSRNHCTVAFEVACVRSIVVEAGSDGIEDGRNAGGVIGEFVRGGNRDVDVICGRAAPSCDDAAARGRRFARNAVLSRMIAEINIAFCAGEKSMDFFGRHVFDRRPGDVGGGSHELLCEFQALLRVVGDDVLTGGGVRRSIGEFFQVCR